MKGQGNNFEMSEIHTYMHIHKPILNFKYSPNNSFVVYHQNCG